MMWTPEGPKSLSGKPLKGRKKGPPKFKVGDLVWVTDPPYPDGRPPLAPSKLGTIEHGPKTSLGKNYIVRFDDGKCIGGDYEVGPQQLSEEWLTPACEPAPIPDMKSAKAGK